MQIGPGHDNLYQTFTPDVLRGQTETIARPSSTRQVVRIVGLSCLAVILEAGLAIAFLPSDPDGANSTQDTVRLQRTGIALQNYLTHHRRLPLGEQKEVDPRYKLPQRQQVGWMLDLLPHIGRTELYHGASLRTPWDSPANRKLGVQVIPTYVNSQIPVTMIDGFAPTHVVGIGGLGESGPEELLDKREAGAFSFHRRTKDISFQDGKSNTLLVGQVRDSFGPWIANTTATIRPFTRRPYLYGPDGFGGPVKGGPTQFLMADGSVRSLSATTDPSIIEALATINGKDKVDATRFPLTSPRDTTTKTDLEKATPLKFEAQEVIDKQKQMTGDGPVVEQVVEIRGLVRGLATRATGGGPETFFLSSSKGPTMPGMLICRMQDDTALRKLISQGLQITVRGVATVDEKSGYFMSLNGCRVVNAAGGKCPELTADALPQEYLTNRAEVFKKLLQKQLSSFVVVRGKVDSINVTTDRQTLLVYLKSRGKSKVDIHMTDEIDAQLAKKLQRGESVQVFGRLMNDRDGWVLKESRLVPSR